MADSVLGQITPEIDEAALIFLLTQVGGIQGQNLGRQAIIRALFRGGITRFTELIALTDDDINTLDYVPHGEADAKPLSLADRKRLIAIMAYYHDVARESKELLMPTSGKLNKADCAFYRVSKVRTKNSIVPYYEELADQLAGWRKGIKYSTKDIPQFRDETQWFRYEEKLVSTMSSLGLEALLANRCELHITFA